MEAQTHPIVVVGAGLSGLTAGYRLQQLGYAVEVYEARIRPGGRICTAYFDHGYEELGGKNIRDGGEARNIRALIHEFGLSTQTHSLDIISGVFLFQKSKYPIAELIEAGPQPTESLYRELYEKSRIVESLADLVNPLFADNPPLHALIQLSIRGYMGSSAEKLSAHYLNEAFWDFYKMQHDALSSSEKYFYMEDIVGGNSRLVEELTKRLKVPIHYNMPLTKISLSDGLQLHFDNGTCVHASNLILAIPASTLRSISFPSGLFPEDQLAAIETQQYGTNAKILIPLKMDYSPNVFNCLANLGIWSNKDHSVMTWYFGGSDGIFEETTPIFVNALPQVEQIFPKIHFDSKQPVSMKQIFKAHYHSPVGVSWFHETYSKGSYSNLSPSQYEAFNEIVVFNGEPLRKVYRPVNDMIYFAGEHTSLDAAATMEGAVQSGNQVARLIHHKLSTIEESAINQ